MIWKSARFLGNGGFVDHHSWLNEADRVARFDAPRVSSHGAMIRCVDVGQQQAFNGTEIVLPSGLRILLFRGHVGKRIHYIVTDKSGRSQAADLGLVGNEDPRLSIFRGHAYLTTVYFVQKYKTCRIELRSLHFEGESLRPVLTVIGKFDTVLGWRGYSKRPREKNWAPFSVADRFFFIYSIRPHRVLELDHACGMVRLAYSSDLEDFSCWGPNISTGELRSNAPPAQILDGSFLSTYHFVQRGRYFTGFYRFEGKPPFRPLAFTAPLLIPDDAEKPIRSNGNRLCIFVTGMFVDQTKDLLRLWGGDSDCRVVNVDTRLSVVLRNMMPA
jgi:hypothetical protein